MYNCSHYDTNNNYYIEEKKSPTNCIIRKKGYYIDKSNSSQFIWRECSEACKTCTAKPEEGDSHCIICAPDYYPVEDEITSNCILRPKGYWIDNSTTPNYLLRKCDIACEECNFPRENNDSMCTKCAPNYYISENSTETNCFDNLTHYFLDETDINKKIWRE